MLTMAMLSEREAVFAETRSNRLSVLNLVTHEWKYYPYLFMSEESDQTELITFPETRYLCLEEKGRYNDHRYKLTYFPYPLKLTEKGPRSIATYQAKENEWTYEHVTKRANNSSMMLWYKPRHDDAF